MIVINLKSGSIKSSQSTMERLILWSWDYRAKGYPDQTWILYSHKI